MNTSNDKLPKILKFWILSWCSYFILQRIVHVLVAMAKGIPYQIQENYRLMEHKSYFISLPFFSVLNIAIWLYAAFIFFWEYDFESPQEIKNDALKMASIWTGLTFLFDFILWHILPLPMQTTIIQRFEGAGMWHFVVYATIFVGTMLGVRPYYTKRVKQLQEDAS